MIERALCDAWHCAPWEIDTDDPAIRDLIDRTLAHWAIEAKSRPRPRR